MLTRSEVQRIEELIAGGGSIRKVARQVRVSRSSVQAIRLGRHPLQLRPEEPEKVPAISPEPIREVERTSKVARSPATSRRCKPKPKPFRPMRLPPNCDRGNETRGAAFLRGHSRRNRGVSAEPGGNRRALRPVLSQL